MEKRKPASSTRVIQRDDEGLAALYFLIEMRRSRGYYA
jgi:hypothetical protein